MEVAPLCVQLQHGARPQAVAARRGAERRHLAALQQPRLGGVSALCRQLHQPHRFLPAGGAGDQYLHGALGPRHRTAALFQHPRLHQGTARMRQGEGHHLCHSYRDLPHGQERGCPRRARHAVVGGRGARRELLAGQRDAA